MSTEHLLTQKTHAKDALTSDAWAFFIYIMNFAKEIKSRITAKQMFEFYGFKMNRAGFCLSPFSNEKTPSLKVYDGSRGWHCFSTGDGGSVIDFVMRYFNLNFQSACAKLNDDFSLGLPIGKELSRQEKKESSRKINEHRRKIEARKRRNVSLQRAYDDALDEWIRLDTIKRECAPRTPDDGFSTAYAYALKNIAVASYLLDQAEENLYKFQHEND